MTALGGLTVALALGGGGARGLAHISVLEILDELGVRPAAIAGTSVGAIVGAAYAAGFSGAQLRAHTEQILSNRVKAARRLLKARARRPRRFMIDFAHPVLLDGERFLDAFWPAGMPARFEELQIPLCVVATDFTLREEAVFTAGPLRPAVAGSMAIPGLVQAAASERGYLIDGGVVNPLPYNHLFGRADIIVAVDLAGGATLRRERKGPPSPAETLIVASQMMVNGVSARMVRDNPPDLCIRPAVDQFLATDIFKYRRIFEAGDSCRAELAAGLEAAAARIQRQRLS